jgi:hypothetical protein
VISSPGSSRTLARWAGAALLCIAALAAAGCASSSSSTPPATQPNSSTPPASSSITSTPVPPASSPASPAVVGAAACANGSLKVALGLGQGYAGGSYINIDFTNTSGSECTLTGFPGVSLVSGPPYVQIGLAAQRNSNSPVKTITLAPGAVAHALLQVVDALNFPTASCGPAKATDLQVFPPNQTTAVYVPYQSEACAEPTQILFISAVAAGSGGQ